MKSPCKRDCPRRNAECHSTCEDYKKYRVKCDEDIKKRELINLSEPDPKEIIKRTLKAKNKR